MPGNNNFNAQHGYGMSSLHHFGGLGEDFMGSARQEVISNPSWGNFDTSGLSGIRRTWGSQWDSRAHPDSMGFFQIPPFDFSLVRPLQTYWWLVGIREFGCESKPFLSRAPPPVIYPFVAACCYIPLLRMIAAGMPYKRTLSQRCLSQARRFCYKPTSRDGGRSLLQTQCF